MDSSTILWIVIIVGAMVYNSVSKARKARQEGENPPPQHGEAWPSIPWNEEDTKPSVPTASSRPATPARTAPSAETAQSEASTRTTRQGSTATIQQATDLTTQQGRMATIQPAVTNRTDQQHAAETIKRTNPVFETVQSEAAGSMSPKREKNAPLSSIHPSVQETRNPDNNRQKVGKTGSQQPLYEAFPDECQSLEEIPFEEAYFSDLDTASDLDAAEEPQTASFTPLTGLGGQSTVRNERRGVKQGKQPQNSTPAPDSLAEMVEEFDLRRAVIYSEILEPKFEEEFNPANPR